jgi:NADPH:quinone reductase-like Zn-dependent oxidoreductase
MLGCMETMQAVRLTGEGGVADLEVARLAVPEPGAGEVLVRVHGAAVTRDELTWPTDRLPVIPSYELSGVVEALGPDTTGVAAGDEVWALTPFDRDGVAAEYALVPAEVLAPKPAELSHVEAAALPLPGLSAWQGLVEHGALRAGERVRITGARGGVGHLAVQIAHSLGAEVVDGAADLLFDTAGGLDRAEAPRVVSVAEEPRTGGTYFVVEPNPAQLGELARLVAQGGLRPEIDSVFPLADARAAFERVAERGKRGKVVIQVATLD